VVGGGEVETTGLSLPHYLVIILLYMYMQTPSHSWSLERKRYNMINYRPWFTSTEPWPILHYKHSAMSQV